MNTKNKVIIFIICVIALFAGAFLLYNYRLKSLNISADVDSRCKVFFASEEYQNNANYVGLAKSLIDVCEDYFPEIPKVLTFVSPPAESEFIIFSDQDLSEGPPYYDYPGYVLNDKIFVKYNYWENRYKADNSIFVSTMLHEMTHVYQHYPTQNNNADIGFLTEGIATYIGDKVAANKLFEKVKGNYPVCQSNEDAKDGYGCTAKFLYFLESRYNPNIVNLLNAKLQQSDYSDNLFYEYTKDFDDGPKTLDQLISEFEKPVWGYNYSNNNLYPYAYVTGINGNDNTDQQYTKWDRCINDNTFVKYKYDEELNYYTEDYISCNTCNDAVCIVIPPTPTPSPSPSPTPSPSPSPTPTYIDDEMPKDPPPIQDDSIDLSRIEIHPFNEMDLLISTGGSIWVNIAVALLLSIGLGYLLFRKKDK